MNTIFPYPGLRPFQSDESVIFFGREKQTDELLKKLNETHFIGVVGPSGCGKSSLVKAGMISALESGYIVSAGSRWLVASMRPGDHPMTHLAEALLEESIFGNVRTGEHALPLLEATLGLEPQGLINVLHETPIPLNTNLLILVDQFEELFRFRNDTNCEQQDAFVALLLETIKQSDIQVYIVITMRSDFIGNCAIFPGLPEVLNQSQYLTPRMNREQREEAIVGPASVFGGNIEPELLNRLLNESGNDPNQLPVLQHLLMRMWKTSKPNDVESSGFNFFENIPKENLGHIISLDDYIRVGGINGALSQHANEAYQNLSENKTEEKSEKQKIVEIIFKSLCEFSDKAGVGRRPTSIEEISARAEISIEKIIEVVEIFRNSEYGFLTPPLPDVLTKDTVIDITHESIIWLWDKLKTWINEEADSVKTYSLLMQNAVLYYDQSGRKAALYDTPNLEIALDWKNRENPSEPWAKRYGGNYKLAMDFLDESEAEKTKKKNLKQRLHLRKLKRARWLAVSISIIVLALVSYYQYFQPKWYEWEDATYYNDWSKKFGIPYGIGELTDAQRIHRSVSFKIIRKGTKGNIIRVEAVNSQDSLTYNHNVNNYFNNNPEYNPERECYWTYELDKDKNILYERAYNQDSSLVWILIYSPLGKDKNIKNRDALFIGSSNIKKMNQQINEENNQFGAQTSSSQTSKQKNTSNKQNDSSLTNPYEKNESIYFNFTKAQIVNIDYTDNGLEERIRYYDKNRNPIKGLDNAFGRKMEYYKEEKYNDMLFRIISIDQNGNNMLDDAGNCIFEITSYDDFGNLQEAVALDTIGNSILLKDGYYKIEQEYDKYGRLTQQKFYDLLGNPTLNKEGFFKRVMTYDNKGNVSQESYYNEQNLKTIINSGYAGLRFKYDHKGYTAKTLYIGIDGKSMFNSKVGYAGFSQEYDERGNVIRVIYLNVDNKPMLNSKEGCVGFSKEYDERRKETHLMYLNIDGKPMINTLLGFAGWELKYDNRGNVTSKVYFDHDLKPIMTKFGYASWSKKIDNKGNDTLVKYLDADNNPIITELGYAGLNKEYDNFGNETKCIYLGTNYKPIISRKDGCAGWEQSYDKQGNATKKMFLNPNLSYTINTKEGCAGWENFYDSQGNVINFIFLNTYGKPMIHRNLGYAGWEQKYDKNGNITRVIYLNNQEKPMINKNLGYAGWEQKYDKKGNIKSIMYLGIDLNPKMIDQGYCGLIFKYDSKQNKIYEGYLNEKSQLTLNNQGFAAANLEYDNYGNISRVDFLGIDNKKILINNTFAGWEAKYDENNKRIDFWYFDNDRNKYDRNGILRMKK